MQCPFFGVQFTGYTGVFTVSDLNNVRNNLSGKYIMMNDLDLSLETAEGGVYYNNGAGWKSIGDSTNKFSGVFDGNGYVIKGLKINSKENLFFYIGLFGSSKGEIVNLGLIDCNISIQSTKPFTDIFVGGIVGYNSGEVSLCYNNGRIDATSNSFVHVGGIIGYNYYGKVDSCYNTGNVSAIYTSNSTYQCPYAGGIVGASFYSTIANCYNSGGISSKYLGFSTDSKSHSGGIVGELNRGELSNCYNIGYVFASSLYGANYGGITGEASGKVTNCIYLDITKNGIGRKMTNEELIVSKKTINEMKDETTFSGFDFNNKWQINSDITYAFPVIRGLKHIEPLEEKVEFAGGTGSVFKPYKIVSKEHLNNIRKYNNLCFKLMNNLEFSSQDFEIGGSYYNEGKGWVPIGSVLQTFGGIFDGNGYFINGLRIDYKGSETGLFGNSYGQIKNLGIKNCNFQSTITSKSTSYLGGLVGYNSGDISNCYTTGVIKSTANVSLYSGGIAGYNFGNINNCYNSGEITVSCASSGSSYAGGIVGYNNGGTINNCFNSGVVIANSTNPLTLESSYAGGILGCLNKGTVSNCYNVGNVIATSVASIDNFFGGIVGNNLNTVFNCYYLDTINKGVGKGIDQTVKTPIEDMKSQTTYKDFDFIDTWTMSGNLEYLYPEIQDKFPPIISIDGYETNFTNKDITVLATTDQGTLNTASHTFMENGSFEFVATDDAGNVTRQMVTITNIDKVAPVITVKDSANNVIGNNEVVFSTKQVAFSVNEGNIVITKNDQVIIVPDDSKIVEEGTYEITATDLAGNLSKIKFTIAKPNSTLNNPYSGDEVQIFVLIFMISLLIIALLIALKSKKKLKIYTK